MISRRHLLLSFGSATTGIAFSPKVDRGSKFGSRQERLIVTDPRPVKVAVAELEKRYGWVVTYEDPPHIFAGELENVSRAPGTVAMRLRTQRLEVAQSLPAPSANPDRITLLNAVLAADAALVGRQRFTLRASALGVHVVPTAYRDVNGEWVATNSILDAKITMPSGEQNVLQYLESYCTALGQAIAKPVIRATMPDGWLASRKISLSVNSQPASDVLLAVLQSLNRPLTWHLLCSPVPNRGYFLNIVPPG
jgi:hypothetical protein